VLCLDTVSSWINEMGEWYYKKSEQETFWCGSLFLELTVVLRELTVLLLVY
jgi:hypothetical protein